MDIMQVPALPAVTGLNEAWSVIENARRSALVIQKHDEPYLITAPDIIDAEQTGKTSLVEIEGTRLATMLQPLPGGSLGSRLGYSLGRLEPSDKLMKRIAEQVGDRSVLGQPHRRLKKYRPLEERLQSLLFAVGGEIGVVDFGPGYVILLSQSEDYLQDHAEAPRRCYCTGPRRHRQPQGATSCGVCGSTVRCKG